MSATDELRRMLDERGVEYETDDRNGLRETIWCDTAVFQLSPTAKMTMIVTPEQAIAATLGSDRESELQSALNKAAGNWAKADDRLRKALSFMRIWISEDAHIGESELSAAFEKAEGLRKLDAIESAITATLGSGACSIEWRDESYDTDAGYERDGAYFCTACGADLPYSLQECWDDYQAGNGEKPFDYCPNCGCKVVDE